MISSSLSKASAALRKQSCRRRTRGGNSGAGEASRKNAVTRRPEQLRFVVRIIQSSQPAQTAPADQSSMASAVTSLVNQYRSALGLSLLTLDSSLCRVAQAKAEDMIANGYFDHISPTYGSPSDMLRAFGISYSAVGENIAAGQSSAQAVMDVWMNSEMHRFNILSSYFSKIGVGYALSSSGQPYWVQISRADFCRLQPYHTIDKAGHRPASFNILLYYVVCLHHRPCMADLSFPPQSNTLFYVLQRSLSHVFPFLIRS